MIKVLSIDPSMRNLGVCLGEIDPDTMQVTPLLIDLIKTDGEAGKTVRRNSDDLRRARLHWSAIAELMKSVDIVMAEIPVGTQSARGAMSNGICIGLMAAITKPLIEVTPSEAKMVTVGRKTATKDEMIDWAATRFPNLKWLTHRKKGVEIMNADNEHMADAVAILHAGAKTAEFRAAATMLKAIRASMST